MSTIDPETAPPLPRPRLPREFGASTSYALKRLAMLLKTRIAEALEPTGLSSYHHAVLALLEEEPSETQAQIADALGYDRSHLVGLLDELEQAGLVERRRDADDRRRHLVTMTPEGKKTLARLRTIVTRVDDEFLAPLDPDERAMLHQLLLKLAASHDERYAL